MVARRDENAASALRRANSTAASTRAWGSGLDFRETCGGDGEVAGEPSPQPVDWILRRPCGVLVLSPVTAGIAARVTAIA
jgi:hypothetical protein